MIAQVEAPCQIGVEMMCRRDAAVDGLRLQQRDRIIRMRLVVCSISRLASLLFPS